MRLLFTVIVCLLFTVCQAQGRVTKKLVKEYYADGSVKSVKKIKERRNINVDPYNYYKKTRVEITLFDSLSGVKYYHSLKITIIGEPSSHHCIQKLERKTYYDSKGRKMKEEVMKCDEGYRKLVIYNKGRKSFISINKRR
ncbi:MAG: hypothetical protein Fur0041_07640 [Bacteroidia bacterium]